MKLIVDLINSGGFELMRKSVSNTAEYGDYYAGRQVIGKESRAAMKEILRKIQNGEFASEFMVSKLYHSKCAAGADAAVFRVTSTAFKAVPL